MDEFKFVMKCFLFAAAVLALTQLKTNGLTIESRIQNTLLSSPVSNFINNSAEGGVKLIEKATEFAKEKWSGLVSSNHEPVKQLIRYPAAKKTVDNSELRIRNGVSTNDEVSADADFGYETE